MERERKRGEKVIKTNGNGKISYTELTGINIFVRIFYIYIFLLY